MGVASTAIGSRTGNCGSVKSRNAFRLTSYGSSFGPAAMGESQLPLDLAYERSQHRHLDAIPFHQDVNDRIRQHLGQLRFPSFVEDAGTASVRRWGSQGRRKGRLESDMV